MEPPRERPGGEPLGRAALEAVRETVETAAAALLEDLRALGAAEPLAPLTRLGGERLGLAPEDAAALVGGVAAALPLVAAAALVRRLRRGRGARSRCRWRREGFRGPGARLSAWRCTTCGVVAYAADARPPKECKRDLRETAL